jgi:zinc transport system ATP-binding protein
VSATSSIIDIHELDFAYRQQLVLKQIHLHVEPGTTLGLVGPNGGGKTTLIRLLLGLLWPTRGIIRIDGMEPQVAVRRGDIVGYLPQNPRLPANFPLSVRQLARVGLAGKTGMLHSYSRDDLRFVDFLIERIGLKEIENDPVGQLSGGQLQRALIARALAPRPKVLLLDEPTTGIDRVGQQQFIDFIQRLKQDLNLTVVLVSHDLRAVTSISDRIACLNVTLHYHDVPDHMPAELVFSMFGCDLAAVGLGHRCTDEGMRGSGDEGNKATPHHLIASSPHPGASGASGASDT